MNADGKSDGRVVPLNPANKGGTEPLAESAEERRPAMRNTRQSNLDRTPKPSEEDIRIGLSGNLCRCTGYTKIVAAVARAADELSPERST